MQKFDIAIIGGGIMGASIFSEVTRRGVKAVLLEKEADVSTGSTKANSGIVHAGYDPIPGTLKAKFNLRGSQMYPSMCSRLGVDILQCGTLVVANEENRKKLEDLLARGIKNGVPGLRIIEREELHKMEPNLADNVDIALFAPTGAVITPYLVCIALCEEGVLNGGEVKLNFKVAGITQEEDGFVVTNGEESIKAEFVVNCAGVNGNEINKLIDAPTFPMKYVKGEYLLLDKSQIGFVNRPIFPLPTIAGKGILATLTLHGNIMLGPTAIPCKPNDTAVSDEGVSQIKEKIVLSVKEPNYKKVIKLFAGVRVISGEDFIIDKKEGTNYYYTIGICSPGLTASPAIAEYLVEKMHEDGLKFKKHKEIKRQPYITTENMEKKKLKELIKQDGNFGKIVCRCEKITEGEIIAAMHSPLKPTTVDGIKRRIRTTMGRCQGGFCLPKLIKIMAREMNVKEEDITFHGENSEILSKN